MADTIARLIFEASTDDLKKAQKELDALTKAAGKTSKEIPKVGKNSKKTTKDTNKLADSFRNASTATAALQGPLNGLSGRLSFIATGLRRIGVSGLFMGTGIAASVFAAKNALDVFSDFEKQMFKLEALVKSTGGSAGFTGDQLNEMAESLARGTLASASQMREAQGVLLTFRTVSGDIFRDAIGLTQDIAAVMGTTAVSGAKQLGKALEDPTRNLTALTRAGISFTKAETNKIKQLQFSGNLLEAQSIVIEKLKGQVGGAGTGGGLSAATDLLSDNFTEFNRVLAEETGLANLAAAATQGLADGVANLTDALVTTDIEKIASLNAELERTRNLGGQAPSVGLTLAMGDPRSMASMGAGAGIATRSEEQIKADIKKLQENALVRAAIEEEAADKARDIQEAKDLAELQLEEQKNSIKLQMAQEARLRAESDEVLADEMKLERMHAQNQLEFEIAVEKYGALDSLEQIRREKNRAADAEFNDKKIQDAKKAEKFEFDARKRGVQSGIQLLSAFSAKSKTIRKAIVIAETGMALADNARTTAVNMGLAAQSQLSLPTPDAPARAAAASAQEKMFGVVRAAAIMASAAGRIGGGGGGAGGGGGGGAGAVAAQAAPVQPAANDEITQAPQAINVTVDGSIDPEGARRIIEAINEATDDGLEINALVGS